MPREIVEETDEAYWEYIAEAGRAREKRPKWINELANLTRSSDYPSALQGNASKHKLAQK
jgi:hypothetical protein